MALAREIVKTFYGDCLMNTWIEGLVAVSLLFGSLFALIGALGLYKLPDFYMRLHGPTKATTLGVGGMVVASMVYFSSQGNGISLHELLITLFLFITAPVSAHMLAKAALQQKLRLSDKTRGRPWEQ
jgi:multicomponent K+:H+ antiporter subunit G